MWREAIVNNDYFRLSRKPFSIGIAGDSGSGKDTLVNSYIDLFVFYVQIIDYPNF